MASPGLNIGDRHVPPLSANGLSNLVRYHPSADAPTGLISLISRPAGSLLTRITTARPHPRPAWFTLQTSPTSHVTLNSALLFMNHSCDPTVEIDVAKMELRVSRHRDLQPGDEISFFYPSTEWIMDRAFQCECGSGSSCLGWIAGAKALDPEMLHGGRGKWWINEWLLSMNRDQDIDKQ